jgi:hypothetical protein
MSYEFPLIEVTGDAYELGRQHGEQAAPLVERYLRLIERLTGQPRDVLARNAMGLAPHLERLGESFMEEVRGLAEGAGISFAEAVLCQARAEAANRAEGACTSFALTGEATADGRTLAGQNQDLETEYADVAMLLRVRPTDGRPAALMFTFAGQLGYSGLNAHGVAHFANSLYDFDWRPGLPHYPLKRVALEQRTVAQVIDLMRRHRTCSAGNLMLADGEGTVGDVEVRPEGVAVFEDDHPDKRLHTNHYLTPEFAAHETDSLPDSRPRLERVRELVQDAWGTITVDVLKEILADHAGDPAGICRHGTRDMHSISGYIAETERRVLHVRRGHGCLGTWTAYHV